MLTGRRTITILLVALAATTLAFATGAAVVNDPTDILAEERLAVQPADGPNGDYAYLNDDNEIVIDLSASNPNLRNDFEGINPDALTAADGVFTVTCTANEYARVWIDHPEENATFVVDGTSIEGRSNNVTLGPNETVPVGLRVDARGAAAGTTLGGDDFDIRAEIAEPENIQATATDDDGATTTVWSPRPAHREFEGSDLPADEETMFDADGMQLSEYATLDRVRVTSATGGDVAFETTGSAESFEIGGPLNDSRGARPEAYFKLNHTVNREYLPRRLQRQVSPLSNRFSVFHVTP